MKIGPHDLEQEVLVVAEIGNNHEGDFELAKRMIARATEAGAQAVKFQVIVPDRLVSASQTERIRQLSRFQLSSTEFEQLAEAAREQKVLFLATPFDLDSVRFLKPLVAAFKIASGDNDFFPLLEAVARTGKPVILSTGLLGLADVRRSKEFIEGIWQAEGCAPGLALLHCVVNYPTMPADAHLLAIRSLQTLGVTVGYSDHTLGIEAAVLSVALGARIIEKHFTLDHHQSDFRDHQLSAEPSELAELVRRVKQAQALLGAGEKCLRPNEEEVLSRVRRSIVAGRDLEAGTVLAWEDLSWVRPGGGLPPGQERRVLDRKLVRSLRKGEMIREQDMASGGRYPPESGG
jgi:N-acetylneuraminate synthase/N,N'-diacetyllegionaminate synthase